MKRSFTEIVDSVSEHFVLQAIKRGFSLLIPILMAGSLALVIVNFPLTAYQNFLTSIFGTTWKNLGIYVYNGTFTVLAICMVLTMSFSLGESFSYRYKSDLQPMITAVVALCSFFILTRFDSSTLELTWLGAKGLFTAILISLLSSFMLHGLYSLKWLRIKIFSQTADPVVTNSLSALIPAIITLLAFSAIHMVFDALRMEDIHQVAYAQLSRTFGDIESASIKTGLIYVVTSHIYWFFGLHGTNILETVVQSHLVPNLAANQAMVAEGLAPTIIYTKEFFDVFVFLGGSGATLSLIVALLFATHRGNARQIGAISAIPGLFNVNEIAVFGMPLVLNIYFLIPFILVPVVLTLFSAAVMQLGFVPLTVNSVNWTTPIVLSGYVSTGSATGSVLQLINLAIGALIYLPFVKLQERHLEREYTRNLMELQSIVFADTMGNSRLIDRRDNIGSLARTIAATLKNGIAQSKLTLEYQPQITSDGKIHGTEALLRWNHEVLGNISPVVVVRISEEAGLSNELSRWVTEEAFRQLVKWNDLGIDIVMSVNLSPRQLYKGLYNDISSALKRIDVNPAMIEFEITEQAALGGNEVRDYLRQVKTLGVKLSMDDFGMGHSSLMYLMDIQIDTIKLDGMLVRDILTNHTSGEIIKSIVELCRSSDIAIIAEFVDTVQKRDKLKELGCHIYQGYLYSRSLTAEAFEEFYFDFDNERYM